MQKGGAALPCLFGERGELRTYGSQPFAVTANAPGQRRLTYGGRYKHRAAWWATVLDNRYQRGRAYL